MTFRWITFRNAILWRRLHTKMSARERNKQIKIRKLITHNSSSDVASFLLQCPIIITIIIIVRIIEITDRFIENLRNEPFVAFFSFFVFCFSIYFNTDLMNCEWMRAKHNGTRNEWLTRWETDGKERWTRRNGQKSVYYLRIFCNALKY